MRLSAFNLARCFSMALSVIPMTSASLRAEYSGWALSRAMIFSLLFKRIMENHLHLRIRNDISEYPDSFQIFQESVRYYSGCGYITDLSTRHRPGRIASDVQAAPRFQIISPRRPSACRRVRYKRRFAQDTCRVGTQNALEGRFPAFAAGPPTHAHTRTRTRTRTRMRKTVT